MKPFNTLIDFITGKEIPDIGAEANRQAIEKYLVNEKGFEKADIETDTPIEIIVAGENYRSKIDLVVCVEGTRFMAIKCAAGSLGSWEREILAASRLLDKYQLPFSLVSDGKTAIFMDTISGEKIGEGLNVIPSKKEAKEKLGTITPQPFPKERMEREKLIFRSYDSMKVNR